VRPFRCRCGRIPLRESTLPVRQVGEGVSPTLDADANILGCYCGVKVPSGRRLIRSIIHSCRSSNKCNPGHAVCARNKHPHGGAIPCGTKFFRALSRHFCTHLSLLNRMSEPLLSMVTILFPCAKNNSSHSKICCIPHWLIEL
jgi:hypothetical protein